ncbi:MAG: hypothetical protein G01um101491_346, partial [Parcubacteria group bacterium Gr01-1014_91]
MPRKRNSPPPPPVMTWKKASWVLVIAGVSDVLRYMFLFFWFFAPALAIAYCSAEVNGLLTTWTAGLLGAKTAGLACSTGVVGATVGAAVVTGGLSAAAIQAFGTVMAMAVGFAGWLAVTIIIFATDRRTLGRNPITVLWMLEGLGASVLVMALGVYRTQIKTEKVAFAKWKKENADALAAEKRRQASEQAQAQAAQQSQLAQQQEQSEERAADEELVMYRGTGADGLHPKEGSVIYVSPSKEFASERAAFLHKDKAATHTVRVRVKNTFDYENEDHVARLNVLLNTPASTKARFEEVMHLNPSADPTEVNALLQQTTTGRNKMIRRGEWNAIESPRVKQALQKLGFDSFHVREVVDGKSYKNLGVFDASKVASEAAEVAPEVSLPPPIPMDGGELPPPIPEDDGPPPIPGTVHSNVSKMKERSFTNPDERSVEQVMLRNNSFIVHTLAGSGVSHHNANSNVSDKATYGDDMDIMLAFEPSVSSSSITPGEKANLWSPDGFLLAGGQIGEAGGSDIGTRAHAIKRRGGANSSIEKIDEVVGRNSEFYRRDYKRFGHHGYNEVVVNDAKVFGFFQQAEKDKDGRYWSHSLKTKEDQ